MNNSQQYGNGKSKKQLRIERELTEDWRSVLSQAQYDLKLAYDALREIQEWQFEHCELARTTPVYKIAYKIVGDYYPTEVLKDTYAPKPNTK